MRAVHASTIAVALLAASCGGYGDRYPSYETVASQYAEDLYRGAPLDAGLAPACDPDACDCPRVLYDARWVYYCDGRWVYWEDGSWFTYAAFYVTYEAGVPVVVAPARNITKEPPPGGGGYDGAGAAFSDREDRAADDGAAALSAPSGGPEEILLEPQAAPRKGGKAGTRKRGVRR